MVFHLTHIYDVHMYITIELKQIKNDTRTQINNNNKNNFQKNNKTIRHTCVFNVVYYLNYVQYIITIKNLYVHLLLHIMYLYIVFKKYNIYIHVSRFHYSDVFFLIAAMRRSPQALLQETALRTEYLLKNAPYLLTGFLYASCWLMFIFVVAWCSHPP